MNDPKPQEPSPKPEGAHQPVGGLGGLGTLGGLPPDTVAPAPTPSPAPKPQAGFSTPPIGWKPTMQPSAPGWKPTMPENIAGPFKRTILDEPPGPEPTPEQLATDQEGLWKQLATTELLSELKKAALAAHSDEDLSTLAATDIFAMVSSLNQSVQNTFTMVATELSCKRRCLRSETMAMNMAVEALALARVIRTMVNPLEKAKRDAGMSKDLGMTPNQLRTGKSITTYPGTVKDVTDDPTYKTMLSAETLENNRKVSHPAATADEMRKMGVALMGETTAVFAGRGDVEATAQSCFVLTVAALIVVWDLRMWWALRGKEGFDERVKTHRKQQQVEARVQRKGRRGKGAEIPPESTE